MVAPRFLLLLQLSAVTAASSLLVLAARCGPVDAALPPMSRNAASASTGVPAAVARRLSHIPAAAPAAAVDDDYDTSADAPDAADDYDYDIPARGAPEWPDDDDDVPAGADSPAAASPSGEDDAEADQFPSNIFDFALLAVLFVLSLIGGPVVFYLLAVGLVKCAASLSSYVGGLYAAAKTAREKATRVRRLDQDAIEAAGH